MPKINISIIKGSNELQSLFEQSTNSKFQKMKLKYNWEKKTVIRLDFNTVPFEWEKRIYDAVISKKIIDQLYPETKTRDELKQLYKGLPASTVLYDEFQKKPNEFVLLIDEYDNPLNANMNNSKKFEELQKYYQEFFQTVKSLAEQKFIFKSVITGILKFSQVGIFSGTVFFFSL